MAATTSSPPPLSSKKKKSNKRKRIPQERQQLEKLDSLQWNPSLPLHHNDNDNDHDPFSLLVGSTELDGGFLSLEEIDEADYELQIPKPEKGKVEKKSKSKKQKNGGGDDEEEDFGDGIDNGSEEMMEEEKDVKNEKKKKKKKKKKATKSEKSEQNEESVAVSNGQDDVEEKLVDDGEIPPEYVAWSELRLQPLLMRSIYRLGFKEPTPIQKACIPAAAHQGKDVVGAAETGSGKTLAFGLPILQRLLDEREKAAKMLEEKGEEEQKYAPKGLLRALIITPTRELALQVTDHLKAVAKDISIRVVPIVGGMSTEKQERLLKARPEIIVGTPGRLWERLKVSVSIRSDPVQSVN